MIYKHEKWGDDKHYSLTNNGMGTWTSTLVPKYGMSKEAIDEYHAGYDYNEMMGDKKEW